MRFWQKAFLILLSIFTLVFNIGMYTIVHLNYTQELSNLKDRAAGEEYFITNSLYKDFSGIEQENTLTYDTISKDFAIYQKYYEEQGIYLELWNQDTLFSKSSLDRMEEIAKLTTKASTQNILIRQEEDKQYVFVASMLPAPYGSYKLVLAYSTEELLHSRAKMIRIMVIVDILFTVALAVVLYLVIRKLMKPLEQLSHATETIANGEYEEKINIKGKDEFADLAMQFNKMSECIAEKVNDLKEENENKKVLIDNMAHEIRTPLTAILGYSEYLKMAKVGEEERVEVLENTISEARRLEKLSKTLLKMAAIREEDICYHDIDMNSIVTTLQFVFHKLIDENKIKLNFITEIDRLQGDQEMIEMLLINLIENAIRACEQSGIINVRFTRVNDRIVLSVEDNGIGMDQSELEKITEPFYRVDKARSRKHGGVGLGVSLCRQIAEYHNATLLYESEPSVGTTAMIIFTT